MMENGINIFLKLDYKFKRFKAIIKWKLMKIMGIIKNDFEAWDKPIPMLRYLYHIYFKKEELKEERWYASFINYKEA